MTRALDFVLVGAPRSGTTSLFRHLRRHRGLFIPAGKEVPFFSEEEWLARGWDAYVAEYFAGAAPQQLWGTLTPQYWDAPEVPPRLRQQCPDARLLALLRNPVDRTYSHYRFLVRRGVEPRPFEDAVMDPDWRKRHHYLPLGDYGRILDGFLEEFPAERLLVLFTDDLERRPQRVLTEIQEHLGLSEPFPEQGLERRYNAGGTTTRLPWLVPLVRRTPARRLWHALPQRARQAVGKWYFFEVAPKPEAAGALPPDVRRRLVDHFRPQVARLEEIAGRTVPWEEFRS